jgi:hypothetical protein
MAVFDKLGILRVEAYFKTRAYGFFLGGPRVDMGNMNQ